MNDIRGYFIVDNDGKIIEFWMHLLQAEMHKRYMDATGRFCKIVPFFR